MGRLLRKGDLPPCPSPCRLLTTVPSCGHSGYCNHESTLQELAQRTVDPEYRGTISKTPPTPAVPLPDVSKAGSCNTYIPPTPGNKGLAIDRYLWTVQWFIANGFYVMIDW